ncbi:MAG: FliM/FliN family flagellar motor switch protein [Verrucomicrobiota bacterium]|nr:FliM/FliN family flagellar motor switch protein [Verrucomicrobiota bacterium]
MDLNDPLLGGSEVLSQSEVERLLAEVAQQESSAPNVSEGGVAAQPKESVQHYDFRQPTFLSATELRKIRMEHEGFVQSLASLLSIYLRVEFGVKLARLQTMTFQKFSEILPSPSHLTLFKVEPLRGICILDINPRLGLTIVDRLMGGAGHSITTNRDLSDIEVVLLDQAIQIILSEWCKHWAKIQELRPVLLGHETNGKYLQTSSPDTVMLVVSIEASMGDCVEHLQLGFPYATLDPLTRQLDAELHDEKHSGAPVITEKPKWNRELESLKIPLTAEWPGIAMTARELANLKVGDILEIDPEAANQVQVRLSQIGKFIGRIGSRNNRRAVEITQIIKSS